MCRYSVQLSPWQLVIRSPDSVLFVSTFNRLSLACLPPEPFPSVDISASSFATAQKQNIILASFRLEVVVFFILFFYY